ncbi:type II toxin-antitoxin system RelE/ParE family toxin [Pseudohaliea sp.]|uniref:type II toxin-antitoxin system RelE family toxin n=1 Tax=Pseudohaliea sp. TaxID=2740289 RepID=UPI0032EDFEF5
MGYTLSFKKSVARDLRGIPRRDVERILKRIEALRTDPRPANCEKLSGQDRYRVRQGVYRIVYEIVDERLIVIVIKVAHRKRAYRKN